MSRAVYIPVSATYDEDDLDSTWDSDKTTRIVLSGDTITLEGNGATIDGNRVIISAGGTYVGRQWLRQPSMRCW